MAWENINEMFPNGGVQIDNKWLSNEEIINSDTKVISYLKFRTVRGMRQENIRYTYTSDGDFTITKEYDIFP